MGQPSDILGLIITVCNTPAQPIARRAAALLYIARRNSGNKESSWKLFPGKSDIECRSSFKNLTLIYLWRYSLHYITLLLNFVKNCAKILNP